MNNPFFGASQWITNDQDVFTAGSLQWANNNTGTVTLNGVVFANGAASTSGSGANAVITWTNLTYNQANGTSAVAASNSGSNLAPFTNLSSSYQALLSSSSVAGNSGTVVLSGLTAGRAYVMQAWANNSAATATDHTRWFVGNETTARDSGLHTALRVNTTAVGNNADTTSTAVGAVGQHFLTAFTSGSNTATFNIACSNAVRINAVQVRDVTGYWLGNTSGTWSDSAQNFMGGMAFNNPLIQTGGFAAFTDLARFEGVESHSGVSRTVTLNRNISIQSAGVSIGTVRFENNSETYTFTNASGSTGITGATAVLKTGSGRVVFNSANTYSGATTVNAGTLVVNNTSGSGTGSGTLTLAAGARLEGIGIIGGPAVISGTHAPGNSPGTQTFTNGVQYTSTSIFEWELTSNTTAGRGANWDAVNLTTSGTMTAHPDAVFRLVLDAAVNFSQAFWETNQSWNVFVAGTGASITSVFQKFEVTGGSNYDSGLGSFSMNSSGTLLWTVNDGGGLGMIPEPSTLLVGLLMGAGLMRRRRSALVPGARG